MSQLVALVASLVGMAAVFRQMICVAAYLAGVFVRAFGCTLARSAWSTFSEALDGIVQAAEEVVDVLLLFLASRFP